MRLRSKRDITKWSKAFCRIWQGRRTNINDDCYIAVARKAKRFQIAYSMMDLSAAVLLCFAVSHCITDFASGVCNHITYATINDIRRSEI